MDVYSQNIISIKVPDQFYPNFISFNFSNSPEIDICAL
jgi:hypothetical protein